MAENHSAWLSTAMAIFLPWSTLTFAVRVWTKLRTKNWGLDDYFILAAVATGVAHIATSCVAIQHGFGHPLADISPADLTQAKKALYAGQIFYILSIGLCRVSAAFFIAHMTYFGPQSKPAYIFVGLSTCWTLASMFVVAFRGNVGSPWNTMEGTPPMYSRWIGVEATGLAIEFGLWILSLHLVWGLQMRMQKRGFILSAFGARLGLIPIVTYRLMYLRPEQNHDLTLDAIVPNILTHAAVHFSIIAGSITCLKPFLRTFNPACAVESRGQPNSSRNGTRDSYYKLETLKRTERSVVDSDDSANWRPFQGSGEGHVVAYPKKSHSRTRDKVACSRNAQGGSQPDGQDGTALLDAEGADRMVIQRTTEVSIKYEQNSHLGHA